jgi:hypothetical protein
MKLYFSQQNSEIFSNNKFHENRSMGTEFFHADGQTDRQIDRHEKANSFFSYFCKSAKK